MMMIPHHEGAIAMAEEKWPKEHNQCLVDMPTMPKSGCWPT